MIKQINKDISIRPLEDTDKKAFISLQLKKGDKLELQRMLEGTIKEYLEWHFEEHLAITNVIIHKGKISGFFGITDMQDMFFLTSQENKMFEYCLVKYFKEGLNELMDERKVTRVQVFMDAQYEVAKHWAIRGGFKKDKEVEILDNTFDILVYNRQIVAN